MSKKTAIELIADERRRQIEVEGWSLVHDGQHRWGQLADAAACYALTHRRKDGASLRYWPWDERSWKPTPDDRVRELVKAGALIVAEIDRIAR